MNSYEDYLLGKVDIEIQNQIKTRSRDAKKNKPSNIFNFSDVNNMGSNSHR